jgi:hypothetical protein
MFCLWCTSIASRIYDLHERCSVLTRKKKKICPQARVERKMGFEASRHCWTRDHVIEI